MTRKPPPAAPFAYEIVHHPLYRAVRSHYTPTLDLSGLLKNWHYEGFVRTSTELAQTMGYAFVAIRDVADEDGILAEWVKAMNQEPEPTP